MRHATAEMRALSRRLLDLETESHGASPESRLPAGLQVCEKLYPQLAILMGSTGVQALVARAQALAGAEVAWLRALELQPSGTWKAFDDAAAQVTSEEKAEGNDVLVAQLLGLLVAFIGEGLTLRMLREIWPQVSVDDLNPE